MFERGNGTTPATRTVRRNTVRPVPVRRIAVRSALFVFASFATVYALYPVVWIVASALSPLNTLVNQTLIPAGASVDNFITLATNPRHPFLLWMWNSVKIAGTTAILVVTLTALAAYAFSRFRYRGRRGALYSIMIVQVFPNMLAVVALFLLLQQIGRVSPMFGLNSHGGLILIYSGGALGFNTWLMKGYFDSIPRELDESALIDGLSYPWIFLRITLPLARPILVVVGFLTFIATYSDFLIARVMLTSTSRFTLAVGMALFIQGEYTTQWGVFSAAALMGAVPIVIIFFILQKQLIGGLVQGSTKG